MIQGEKAAGKDNALKTIIRNGKILHLNDYKNIEYPQTSGNAVWNADLGNQTMYQFEKEFRKEMLGK